MKTVYFVRHGESESNAIEVSSGSGNDIALTATGRQQAKKAGQELKDKHIELMVCSPMIRTIETATIIAKEIGYDPKEIVQNPLFIERNLGIYEGLHREKLYGDIANGRVHESVETEKHIHDRLKEALSWLENLDENNIVVVSHGNVSRAVRVITMNLHYSHMSKLEPFGNGEIYKFSL